MRLETPAISCSLRRAPRRQRRPGRKGAPRRAHRLIEERYVALGQAATKVPSAGFRTSKVETVGAALPSIVSE